jgi:hypothetical protein
LQHEIILPCESLSRDQLSRRQQTKLKLCSPIVENIYRWRKAAIHFARFWNRELRSLHWHLINAWSTGWPDLAIFFAHWVTVSIGQFYIRNRPIIGLLFTYKFCINISNFDKKRAGLHFDRLVKTSTMTHLVSLWREL